MTNIQSPWIMPLILAFLLIFSLTSSADHTHQDFLQCFSQHFKNSNSMSNIVYTRNNPSYPSVLDYSVRNLRFNTTTTPTPSLIITPLHTPHIQAAILCSRKHGFQIRIRSGGHDFEGLSYVSSSLPFIVLDLINLRNITVDAENRTAWVQSGATLGELYYRISEKSTKLAFPAGICPTVGVGGHFSGGGYGMLMRKFGIAADHIIDAQLVDAEGKILDRAAMGEELFWAIRGGGGNTFGVVTAWKIQLVPVPPTVTACTVTRTLEQNATKLIHRWQYVAHEFADDLFMRVFITRISSKRDIQASFISLFLGRADQLLTLMQNSFPELGMVKQDCKEMSWIESTVYFAEFPEETPLDVLLDRTPASSVANTKGKSDYVQQPIPEAALEAIWERFFEVEPEFNLLLLSPYGGRMDEISESSIPFPHRAGNLYQIHYLVVWGGDDDEMGEKYLKWVRSLYSYMAPYVSKKPRAAYFNYRDLDIGMNRSLQGRNITSYREARVWGVKYFKNNFDRLVRVKTAVDPSNFFRNEQSIPVLH